MILIYFKSVQFNCITSDDEDVLSIIVIIYASQMWNFVEVKRSV